MSATPRKSDDMPEPTTAGGHPLKHILEAALLAADEPLSMARLAGLFPEDEAPSNADISRALETLTRECGDRGVELKEVASGYRLQIKSELQPWVSRLWTEKPQKYSRAMLETLSLIAYRQPITRGEIESVRGVSLSSNIIRSLQEREWIRIVGHRDVPGKPALFGTTRTFLDYFELKSLDELPTLAEIKDMESLEPELAFEGAGRDHGGGDGDDPDPAEKAGADGESAAQPGHEAGEDAGDEADDEADNPGDDDTEKNTEAARDLDFDDEPVGDEELDRDFADLDRAFSDAENIDLGQDAPGADEGVDPDSPQGDLVANGAAGEAATGDEGEEPPDDDAESGDDRPPRS